MENTLGHDFVETEPYNVYKTRVSSVSFFKYVRIVFTHTLERKKFSS